MMSLFCILLLLHSCTEMGYCNETIFSVGLRCRLDTLLEAIRAKQSFAMFEDFLIQGDENEAEVPFFFSDLRNAENEDDLNAIIDKIREEFDDGETETTMLYRVRNVLQSEMWGMQCADFIMSEIVVDYSTLVRDKAVELGISDYEIVNILYVQAG